MPMDTWAEKECPPVEMDYFHLLVLSGEVMTNIGEQ